VPVLTFPNGAEVDVQFDDTAHSYAVAHKLADGQFSNYRPTHGATTPLAVVPKDYLKAWAAKEAVNAILMHFLNTPSDVERLPKFFEDLEAYEENRRDENNKPVMSYYRFKKNYPWYSEAKAAFKRKSNTGKELGTWIHSAIEAYYKTDRKTIPIITEDTKGMWDSFIQFDNYFKPNAEELEFFVYSMQFGYSGQGDFKGYIGGKHCIADWKSTNRSSSNTDGIDISYFFQLGGLAQAEFERTGKWVDDLAAVNFDKKGEEPRIVWASDFGMSPVDCARAYISCFNTYHTILNADYKFKKRD
jgi:hypothetical protein